MSVHSSAVSIKGLHKSYLEGDRQRIVLSNVNAELQSGNIHAVVGRSGSGKSTLLNLIAGIDLPDDGIIELSGQVMNSMDQRHRTLFRRRHIGIVFQFFNLIPSLTVEENVMLPLELNRESNRRQRTLEAIERVGLEERVDSYPSALSGGEQQRVAIARAIVHEPDLVLADEPTGNLDEDSALQVTAALTGLRHRSTVIVVTHNVELAGQCDCQWQLRSGALEMC